LGPPLLAPKRVSLRVIAAATLGCCVVSAPAFASGGVDPVIKDCSYHGRLTKTYTQAQYQHALATIPTDADEYSDCRDIIRRAQLAAASAGKTEKSSGSGVGPTGGGTAGGGGAPGDGTPGSAIDSGPIRDPYEAANASADEGVQAKKDVTAALAAGAVQHVIAGGDVRPGTFAYTGLRPVSKLPAPLVLLTMLMLAAALVVGGHLIRTRLRTSRHGR
jgi:hypothetical protein